MTKSHDQHDDTAASDWVHRFASLIPSGAVLDVACGTGRHSRLFLERGHHVVGIDRYNAGVIDLLGRVDFELVEADLENGEKFPVGGRKFAAVIVTNYLHRPLFPALLNAVAPKGFLIYETFAQGNEKYGRPSNPAFLLAPGELLSVVDNQLTVIAYEHGRITDPRPAMVERICAVRGDTPAYLGEEE